MGIDQILNFLIPAVALVVGIFLKKNEDFKNKFIPAATFILALGTRLLNAIIEQLAQPSASVTGATMFALHWGSLLIILKAVLDTVIATGIHSTVKNVGQGLKG